jgi:hypothetical protein
MISASDYDQSCTVDTDCQQVGSGNYCQNTYCICGGSAINKAAVAQFELDVSETPLGSGALGTMVCSCPAEIVPCCRSGKCQADDACLAAPGDTLPACSKAGGTCLFATGCTTAGPPDSCAYADEACCIN